MCGPCVCNGIICMYVCINICICVNKLPDLCKRRSFGYNNSIHLVSKKGRKLPYMVNKRRLATTCIKHVYIVVL